MGDIDITDLVAAFASTWVKVMVADTYAATIAVPFLSWLALPVVSSVYQFALDWIYTWVAGRATMLGFFTNTALRKSGQAGDYVGAIDVIHNLPANVTEEQYAKAEQAEIASFNSLVRIT